MSFQQAINGDYNGKLANMLIKYMEYGVNFVYSCWIRKGLAHMECMVDGSSWSPQLYGRVGGIFALWLKYGYEI
jgi:hypothetical protein